MTTESSKNGAITLSCMNFSGYDRWVGWHTVDDLPTKWSTI